MREWVPVPSSARGRLAAEALAAFGKHGYDGVAVGGLARAAGVTTGSLYHHFGSKLGLYAVVREEVERRVLDRMEGAVAAVAGDGPAAATRAALLVGFDYLATQGLARLLAERHPQAGTDPVQSVLQPLTGSGGTPLGRLLAAAWRAALAAQAEGVPPDRVRAALSALAVDGRPLPPG